MKKFYILLLLSFFTLNIRAIAQNNFKEGFIITLQNDTIKGQIHLTSEKKSYKQCRFRKDNKLTEYTPNKLKSYSFIEDKTYVSGILPDSFVEILISGDLSLYKKNKDYYLQKLGGKIHLLSDGKAYKDEEPDLMVTNFRWRGTLSYILLDSELSTINPKHYKLSEKYLSELVNRYNNSQGNPSTVYKKNKPWQKATLGFIGGIQRETISPTPYEGIDKSRFESNYHANSIHLGFIFNISSPRISDKLSLQPEIHISKTDMASTRVEKVPFADFDLHFDTRIEYTTLSLPVSIKYTFPQKKWSWYMQAGFSFEHNFNTKFSQSTNQVDGSSVRVFKQHDWRLSTNQVSLWGGIGATKSFKKFNGGLAFRYYKLSQKSIKLVAGMSQSRMSLSLIISKK